jgi:hypothetical protein
LPPKTGDETDHWIRLPTAVVEDSGRRFTYRLRVQLGTWVRRILEQAKNEEVEGRRLLPARYHFGRDASGDTFIIADQSTRSTEAN